MKKKAIVIGAGFSGLSAATHLAHDGFEVTLLEKNDLPGGRARYMEAEGFMFDMGPSWYWMPDVFERYFGFFGKKPSDYYDLVRLDPSYTVVFGKDDFVDIPADFEAFCQLFESYEPGSAKALKEFMDQAAYKYQVGMNDLVYKPSRSLTEFLDIRLLLAMFRMDIFTSFHKHIRKFFSHEKIIRLMEFPVLFLGAVPESTPALYSLMNYADIRLGTWYPMGGMHKIVEGMVTLAKEKGVDIRLSHPVKGFRMSNGRIAAVQTHTPDGPAEFQADVVVAGADYHHVETALLPEELRSYSDRYWDTRVMAPSSLLYYIGLNKRLTDRLRHHNLFFDEPLGPHAQEIYISPKWPTKPLFYLSVTSKTDPTVAPEGCENLFLLIPVAPGLTDTPEIREKYYHLVMDRLEAIIGEPVRDSVVYLKSYAHQDFIDDYHAFKGNAYGLANTLMQTAILKPGLKSKKIGNLFFTGQLTTPGPGVPPSLISGKVVATEVYKEFRP